MFTETQPERPRARRRTRPRSVAALLCAAIAFITLAACSSGTSRTASLDDVPPGTVVITGMQFAPADITVQVGDTVTWQFRDNGVPHDVTSTDESGAVAADPVLDSGQKKRGEYTHTFTEPGRYTYMCTLHPDMTGVVTVTQ
ncbi:plastocyanin/azurin family copper-binding protein [Tomitella fengzijianii]|uniref:plastocyanin/azurin family copper-binding protein n=1 Tax=Tomitella fengzijianii TaxID=2597660 RepID=UPI001E366C29|nr:plastocyanin/azurin family copper-binding protein [Tomitella fengzijianii]